MIKNIVKIFIVLLSLTHLVNAQATRPSVIYTTGVPATCTAGRVYVNRTTGDLYTFKTGVGCTIIGGGATGLSEAQVQALINESLAATQTGDVDNFLVSGGQVVWTTGLTFRISPAIYYIKGTRYTSIEQTETLTAADGSNPRLDALYLDTSGDFDSIAGTAAADPGEPSVDPTTQLKLVTVLINAAATTPANVSNTNVYLENTEWTATTNQAGQVNFDGLTNPRTGTKAIVITSGANNTYANFNSGGTISLGTGQFVLYIRPSASWGNKSLIAQLYSTSTARGQAVTIDDGLFGFNSSSVAYQQVVIPDSAFQVPASQAVNTIRFTITGSGGAISFNIDDVIRQTGITPTSVNVSSGITGNLPIYANNNTISDSGIKTSDTAYNATTWNTNLDIPTKNAVRDILESILTGTGLPAAVGFAASDETTAITTGDVKYTFRMPHALTLTSVRCSLTTASSSGLPTFDINESGTTILSTKVTIDANEKTSTTAATAAVISDSSLADNAEITIDFDVAGTGATGVKCWLIGTR
jgi:hypothetical protein